MKHLENLQTVMPDGGSKKSIGEAAGSYLGFSLQLNRMLIALLKGKPGDVAWIEKFDDVGITHADGSHQIEQDAATQNNPISDSAGKLWKTLANWVF